MIHPTPLPGIASFALTPNQTAVATSLDNSGSNPIKSAFNQVTLADASTFFPGALDRLTPESLQYARNIAFIGLSRPLEAALTEDPIQVMFSGSIAEMAAAGELLLAAPFAGEFALAVTRYENKDFAMIDVMSPVVTKGVALAEWARLRGITREEILAVGDNHNDLEMLTFAGIPVVMGNCVSALTCYGWHQTGSNDESGVAAAIERFALSEAASCA